jgi:hypothetical protein
VFHQRDAVWYDFFRDDQEHYTVRKGKSGKTLIFYLALENSAILLGQN